MIKNVSIFDKHTGMILRSISIDESMINLQIGENEDHIETIIDNTQFYVDIETKTLVEIPEKPSIFFTFDVETKTWVYKIEDNIKYFQVEINKYASFKIEFKYPIYKQLNIESDFGKDSIEYQSMRTFINAVRDISNQYMAEIQTLTTEDDMNISFDNYKLELDEL